MGQNFYPFLTVVWKGYQFLSRFFQSQHNFQFVLGEILLKIIQFISCQVAFCKISHLCIKRYSFCRKYPNISWDGYRAQALPRPILPHFQPPIVPMFIPSFVPFHHLRHSNICRFSKFKCYDYETTLQYSSSLIWTDDRYKLVFYTAITTTN